MAKKQLTLRELMKVKIKCTDKVLSDLEFCLRQHKTIEYSCAYAGINRDTYYEWIKASDEFAQKMLMAQEFVQNKALELIERDIVNNENVDTAKYFLDRRDKRFNKQIDANITLTDVIITIGEDDEEEDE